jgi:hypothetical protein
LEPEPEGEEGFSPGMEGLGARILRADRRMSCEDLIANELAASISGAPLEKIRHSCEAIMLLGEKELKQAGISEAEVEDARKLHELSLDLANLYVHSLVDKNGIVEDLYASIPWSFPRKEVADWLSWAEDIEAMYWQTKYTEDLSKMSKLERAYVVTKDKCTVPCARTFLSRFESFAMPEAIGFMKKVITLVSPDSYRAALAIIRGDKRGTFSKT